MPNIAQHQSSRTTKLLLIGDSGSGKTGALASLAQAGYKLRIIDLDNGLDVLRNLLTSPDSPYVKAKPDIAKQVEYITITDTMKSMAGTIVPVRATVWQNTMAMLEDWREPPPWVKLPEGVEKRASLGKITSWDEDTVLVIDSLSFLSSAAYYHFLGMNGKLGATLTQNEWRRAIGNAQQLIKSFLELLYDSSVKCNVILTAHITFTNETGERPDENEASVGYPSAIGRALSPQIPRYFNTVLLAKTVGSGPAARQQIFAKPSGTVNVKSSAPMNVQASYPLDQGLAMYFKAVRG